MQSLKIGLFPSEVVVPFFSTSYFISSRREEKNEPLRVYCKNVHYLAVHTTNSISVISINGNGTTYGSDTVQFNAVEY